MRIVHAELTGVKSYADQTIKFTPGVNAVCGLNGAGKSTILEAIGFALFDYLPYPQAQFIREGENTATVTIRFVSSRDGYEYDVTRRIGKPASYFVTFPAQNVKVAEKKDDVSAWLRDHLGITSTGDIAEVYQNAIGVPQGLLTAAFLETGARRASIFNPLLQVDEYETAWEKLREVERFQKDEMTEQRVAIAKMESNHARLEELRIREKEVGAEIKQLAVDAAILDAETETQQELVQSFDADKRQAEELERQLEMASQSVHNEEAYLKRAENETQRAYHAAVATDANSAAFVSYREAQKGLEDTPETLQAKADIVEAKKELELRRTEYSTLNAEIGQIVEQAAALEAAGEDAVCPTCGQRLPSQVELVTELRSKLAGKRPIAEAAKRDGVKARTELDAAQAFIDRTFEQARAALAKHQEGHLAYSRNIELARRSDELKDEESRIGVLVIEAKEKVAGIKAERVMLAFDGRGYQRARNALVEVERNLAEKNGILTATRRQADNVKEEIHQLGPVAGILQAAQKDLAFTSEVLDGTAKIRSALKEAGPHITRNLVQVISIEANRIFRDIVEDDSLALSWSETYEIALDHEGVRRVFKQLSGGEQMAAALAVRLALLKEMSAVDIAMFDEPTSNLDAERRSLLANQLLNVKGFEQMFVISHDSTFSTAAENVVLIEKVDGVSRVVAG